jgi:hypothetical protein
MLDGLRRDHLGLSYFYYLDVSIDETVRRHAPRPQAAEFGQYARLVPLAGLSRHSPRTRHP